MLQIFSPSLSIFLLIHFQCFLLCKDYLLLCSPICQSFVFTGFLVIVIKPFPASQIKRNLHMFSSSTCMVSLFTFRFPPLFFQFILMYGVRYGSYFFFNLFIYLFWLCWVFVSVRGLSLVAASGGHSSLQCAGLSLSWPLLLRSTGSRCAGSVVVAHGPSCSAACGIFPDQGSNPCALHWQADSQPLRHQGSPWILFYSFPIVPAPFI